MSETKYRAWVEKEKEVVPVITIYFEGRTVTLPIQTPVTADEWWDETPWSFDDVVLMQFIGLKDARGVEVYESDILRFEHLKGTPHEYQTVNMTAWRFKTNQYEIYEIVDNQYVFEVVGNVYENPVLAKNA